VSARVVQSRSRISVLGDHVHPQLVWANFEVMMFLNPTYFKNIDEAFMVTTTTTTRPRLIRPFLLLNFLNKSFFLPKSVCSSFFTSVYFFNVHLFFVITPLLSPSLFFTSSTNNFVFIQYHHPLFH